MAMLAFEKGAGRKTGGRRTIARLLRFGLAAYLLSGWAVPSARLLILYLAILPAVAMHRLVNRRLRLLGRLEPGPGADPARRRRETLFGGAFCALWLLAFAHLALLGDTALLALLP